MGRIIENVRCPLCHRIQALKVGQVLPIGWFATNLEYADQEFIIHRTSVGGQGRGIKGKVKAISGFQDILGETYTLEMAYDDPGSRDKVIALYRSSKKLVEALEAIGLH